MSVEDVAGGVKLAYWDLNKAAYQAARGAYKRAQNVGMKYQNWRHKGAGDETGLTPTEATATEVSRPVGKRGKSWTSDEESFSNTTTSHTTYTRKRTR